MIFIRLINEKCDIFVKFFCELISKIGEMGVFFIGIAGKIERCRHAISEIDRHSGR